MTELKNLKQEEVDKMWDSEFLALLVANLMGREVNTEMPEFVFNRLNKILNYLVSMERVN